MARFADVFSTRRCLLRTLRPDDAARIWALWGQDPLAWHYLAWPRPADEATLRRELDYLAALHRKGTAALWLLCAAVEPAQPLGLLQLQRPAGDGASHHLRVGYQLARPHWGRGLMREALAALTEEAFRDPALWRLDALCDVENPASVRLLQALGWHCEGRLARHSLHPAAGPEPRDVWLYARCRGSAGT